MRIKKVIKMGTLKDFIDKHGWLSATVLLNKPQATLVTRLRSKKHWHVVKVGKKYRCAQVDS